MKRNKSSFDKLTSGPLGVRHKGRLESFMGTVMIVPVIINRAPFERLGTLVQISTPHWEITNQRLFEMGLQGDNGIQSVLLPNLTDERFQESEEDATVRVKKLLIESMKPKSPFPNWENERWVSAGLYIPLDVVVHKSDKENDGLAS